MEQLPASLLYYTSQLQNFVRNTVKLNTLNTQSLSSTGATQLRVALPVNAVASMKSLSMFCDMTTVGTANNGTGGDMHALIPRNGPIAVMDRVTVSAGGIALDNGVTPYHVVYAMRQNLLNGSQKEMSDNRVLQQATIQNKDVDAVALGQKKSFIINNFAGFSECHPEYLDLSLLPQVFVTIQVGSASVCPIQESTKALGAALTVGGAVPAPQYSLDNIHFSLDVCQIGSGMYSALTERVLAERGSVDIPYPQFNLFRQDASSAGASIRASVSCMSLDRVTGFFRNTQGTKAAPANGLISYQNAQPPIACGDSTNIAWQNASDNFFSDGVSDYQLTINNSPIPTYRPTPLQAFNFAVCADDRTYSRSRGGLVSSQEMWLKNMWCAHHRLCFDNEITRISGVNVSSVNAQVSFQTNGGGDGTAAANTREILLMTEQTSILRCGSGRSCAVVA